MDSSDLITFAAVASAGAITRAARELHTVQSNVTARVRSLEREIGAPLFVRHARGVELTGAGERLLPYAREVARLLAEARQAVREDGVPRGMLTLGSIETTAALRLPPILAAYAAACPEVDLRLRTGTTGEMMDEVFARRVEGAFVAGAVAHPELAAEPVVEEELVMVTAPGVDSLDELASRAGVKVLVFRAGCSYRERLDRVLAARGITAARLELGTLEGILGLVGAGIGVTMLPRAVVEPMRARGAVAVHPLPPDDARIVTHFIRRRDGFLSAALRAFIAALPRFAPPVAVAGAPEHSAR